VSKFCCVSHMAPMACCPDWTYDFPAFCMHRHAWPLYTFRQLAGLQFTAQGLLVRPSLPLELGAYGWSSSLASIRWDGNRTWTGHYAPRVAGNWTVVVDLRQAMPEGTVLSISVRLAGDTNVGTVATRAIQGDRPIQLHSPHAIRATRIQFAIVADQYQM
jgi:hypothetical protein